MKEILDNAVNNTDNSKSQLVKEFLTEVVNLMGYVGYQVNVVEDNAMINVDIVNVTGDDTNIIGYRGEVLESLQYLASLVLVENGSRKRIVIDSEGYRARREKTLVQLARNLEQKVKRTKTAVKLEPMNPYERRLIHTALQDSQYVATESDGAGSNRHVVISPKLVGDILNAPIGGKPSYNFVYRSDKKRRK